VTATILALALALAGWSGGTFANAEGFVALGQTGPAVDAVWEFDTPDGTVTFVNVRRRTARNSGLTPRKSDRSS
jgi:hypothetical protein